MDISGDKQLVEQLNKLADLFASQRLLNKAGLAAQRKIKTLTRAGKDAEGKRFASAPTAEKGPYSPGHRRRRLKGHGGGKGLDVSKKNLVFSEQGGMMESMDHVVTASLESVSLHFDDPKKEEIAGFLMAGAGKSKVKHNFFDLSDESVGQIHTLVEREVLSFLTLSKLAV